jgi:hypothetical protein
MWDEARIITNEQLYVQGGLPAPELSNFNFIESERIFSDRIDYFKNKPGNTP